MRRATSKTCLRHQTKGMLSLFEASYLGKEGEFILIEAMDFTTKHLKNLMEEGSLEPRFREHLAHALELPLNWRMQRIHNRWFIETYQREATMNPLLLELAKEMQTKLVSLITVIDDVFDVYGTLDELELFTNVVDRWDVNVINKLPGYMKLCFLVVFDMANDAGYRVTKEKGLDIIPYLKRSWADVCKSYLVEAKWYHRGCTPKFGEYLNNAWTSVVQAPARWWTDLGLAQWLPFFRDRLTENYFWTALQSICKYQDFEGWSSMIYRLYNDLATSKICTLSTQHIRKCNIFSLSLSFVCCNPVLRELIRANWRALNGDHTFSSLLEEYFKITWNQLESSPLLGDRLSMDATMYDE
ncbi:Myrcene synthase, chloroplastic [Musa troglodytarum]|uniref:Myrcene synthase, chloroplastic n=1 Tax=Musa troglodytarum TaxID=320322 RepID=A0A9E7GUQ9_9LILI|nr:Myrcene synthase, chloroplastic [Musa troglodytarum]